MHISVIGGSSVEDRKYNMARRLGQELAARGHTVVCGGLGGVMEAVCRGVADRDGQSIGVLPGADPALANEYVSVPVATGMGSARNALVVQNGAAVIAVDGAYGTLSEIALALDAGKPVAGLHTHDIEGVTHVESPAAAVDVVEGASTD